MPILARVVPLTPLDTLRALLAEYADGDTAFPARLTQAIQGLRKQALPTLGMALRPGATPKGLRRLLLSMVARFDWPEWATFIREALLQESDLGLFDEGCTALGLLGTREAFNALQELRTARPDAIGRPFLPVNWPSISPRSPSPTISAACWRAPAIPGWPPTALVSWRPWPGSSIFLPWSRPNRAATRW
jgi:hypothetical protein